MRTPRSHLPHVARPRLASPETSNGWRGPADRGETVRSAGRCHRRATEDLQGERSVVSGEPEIDPAGLDSDEAMVSTRSSTRY